MMCMIHHLIIINIYVDMGHIYSYFLWDGQDKDINTDMYDTKYLCQ